MVINIKMSKIKMYHLIMHQVMFWCMYKESFKRAQFRPGDMDDGHFPH